MSNYQVSKMELEQVKSTWREYSYGLVYEMSEKKFGACASLSDVCWDECIDARFFMPDKEIHCYRTDDGLQAVCVSDGKDSDFLDRVYRVSPMGSGEVLRVRHYLEYDEDGQVYIALTRLVDVEKEGE